MGRKTTDAERIPSSPLINSLLETAPGRRVDARADGTGAGAELRAMPVERRDRGVVVAGLVRALRANRARAVALDVDVLRGERLAGGRAGVVGAEGQRDRDVELRWKDDARVAAHTRDSPAHRRGRGRDGPA